MIIENVVSRCASRREKLLATLGDRSGKQRMCDVCGLWCWPQERCAAFTGRYKTADMDTPAPVAEIVAKHYPRQLRALELRRSGLTLKQIGERLGGVTRERARQLVNAGIAIEQRLNEG